jgi:broad specificity phosphatase PhoE
MHGMSELIVIRHGETEWSRSGHLADRTDVLLSDAGVAAASALAPALARRRLVAAFTSPQSRAMRTAELAGLTGVKPDPDLLEWDYGGYEDMTEAQIRKTRPGWNLRRDGVIPGDATHPGETLRQVAVRLTRCWAGSGRCWNTVMSPSWRTVTCSACLPRAGSA